MILSLYIGAVVIGFGSQALAWLNVPPIPSGRRTQFYLIQPTGDYKYGYDTGSGLSAKQSANGANQVEGQFSFTDAIGQQRGLKYTAGTQGFVPVDALARAQENSELEPDDVYVPPQQDGSVDSDGSDDSDDSGQYQPDNSGEYVPDNSGEYHPDPNEESGGEGESDGGNQGESYDGNNQGESYDGNNQGESYDGNQGGSYDGNQGVPNEGGAGETFDRQAQHSDASYVFHIDTPSYKRTENSDPRGNIEGSYSYVNDAGTHSLNYVAGAEKGFIAKSGSLSVPNGLERQQPSAPATYAAFKTAQDGSYSFGYTASDQQRNEESDSHGNVRGRYSYKNAEGTHDLTYVAGSATGFLPTGGSLVPAPGLTKAQLRAGAGRNGVFVDAGSKASAIVFHPNSNAYSLGNAKIVTYLPEGTYSDKYGYILDTTY